MLNIKIFGIVQGVGFRPFVNRLANSFNIVGNVSNRGSYVEIYAQGSDNDLKHFLAALQSKNPPRSAILKVDVN
ncbi:MAG: acylphosphatase, partial [Selenomonadaceae bacterium]|nr:acylphosphatase [Selenomonadaceae bacterium]